MSSLLSDLFRGKYVGAAPPRNENPEIEEAFRRAEEAERELKELLPAELKGKFQQYIDACEKRCFLCGEQDFVSGFRLAVRLILEGIKK